MPSLNIRCRYGVIGWVCVMAVSGAPVRDSVRLAIFFDSPRLEGCRCGGVECYVPLGVSEVELASGKQDGSRACAYGVCLAGGRGCVGRSPRLWVLRAVGVFMA